eukprot:gene6111-4388_t
MEDSAAASKKSAIPSNWAKKWTPAEDERLLKAIEEFGFKWKKWLSNLHCSGGLHEKVLEMMLDEVEHSSLIEDAYVRDTCSLKTSWPTILSGPAVLHLPSHYGLTSNKDKSAG